MNKYIFIVLLILSVSIACADSLGTIYCHLVLNPPTAGIGTSSELIAIIDLIVTTTGETIYFAGPCLQEYQSFRLHSLSGRPLVDIEPEPAGLCTGSPCYRDYYTHSSPYDLDRELVATACFFFAADSMDSAAAFLATDYSFDVWAYRPGNTEISLTERFVTTSYDYYNVFSDTIILTTTGPAMDCPPLKAPQCGEIYGITPTEAKGIWHHVMLHEGYQYWVNSSPSPPASGINIDTNYIEIVGLVPETGYFLHVRAWCNCETSGRSYSNWTSIHFSTLPQPITTIKTHPLYLMFIAEDDTFYTTQEFEWPYEGESGPCHWIGAISPQSHPPEPIYFYKEWSDGGGFTHCHRVGATNTTITCYYDSIDADFQSWTPPSPTICAGAVIPVTVTMFNSGSIDWTDWADIGLGSQNPPLNTIWGVSNVLFDGGIVEPGETYEFVFDVTAPDSAGEYGFVWQMGMDSVSFFGERTDSILITVVAKPVAEASNGGPYCANENVNLTGGPPGMITYHWTGPAGFDSWSQSPYLGPGTTSMTGTYTLIIQNGDGCIDTATTYLTVNPKPAATASNTGPYCGGQTIELSSGPGLMASYQWSGPLGFTSFSRNPVIVSADTAHSGRYTVIVTSVAGCVDTASTIVTVYEKPDLSAWTNAPVCEGNLLELRAEPSGLDSYFWHVPGGSIFPGRVLFRNPATPEMSGLYHVVATNSDGCSDTVWIMAIVDTTIKTMRIDSVTADSFYIYEGSTTELHCFVSGAEGDISYSWEPIAFMVYPDSSDPIGAPLFTTTFIVTVTDSQECGVYQVTDSVTITVFNEFHCLLYIDSLTHGTSICRGDTVDLYVDADLEAGAAHYHWSPPFWISSPASQEPFVYPESTITYTITAYDDSGCTDTGEVTIEVFDVRINIEPDSPHICRGDELVLTAIGSGGIPPYDYTWAPSLAVLYPDSFETPVYPESTTIFSVWAVDSFGCIGVEHVTVQVDTAIRSLRIEVSVDDSDLIIGESTRLHVAAFDAEGMVGYDWSPAAYLDAPTSPNPWAAPPFSGWFYITVTDYQEPCEFTVTDSIYIHVEDTSSCPLRITEITEDSHICLGDSIRLSVSVEGATGTVTFDWTPASSLSDPFVPNPMATPTHTTFFWVVVSDDSCSDSGRVIIFVDTVGTTMHIVPPGRFSTLSLSAIRHCFSPTLPARSAN